MRDLTTIDWIEMIFVWVPFCLVMAVYVALKYPHITIHEFKQWRKRSLICD